ncbi:ABC transporter ATP-binding protein [Paracoccus siganidrum]|uniref:ABC transporter ATP-binding protein n=1 Tax=Paracoccus siganidrum TaxID=1276757 RepID=A0A419A8S1_9RHOB|nr:ABC transporter ATP-binding protein [Paracoccus siganidrum]RJL18494.1 ABC transporter ATP-binding protein [Paracoccus siganidrum]RMC39794.1 dipeptide ABC transporter ATP-binding protein DppD [Paracoccus siganidrum]
MPEPVLSLGDLQVRFRSNRHVLRAVDGVGFDLMAGQTLGLVGESGCGKSVTSLAIMRLLPTPPAEIAGGRIIFEGKDLLQLSERRMRQLRGGRIGMIFQEPMTSLNPVYTCGDQIIESLRRHSGLSGKPARDRAIELLDLVGLPSPERRVDDYPHQLSGGQRQRVMIALALANDPAVLIADEPTTALDVTIQSQILDLLRELQERTGTAILMITHDLGVVAETCQAVAVMYAGTVVERGEVGALFADPQHPYTIGLMAAVPRMDTDRGRLVAIPGSVPPPWQPIAGCRFASRCPLADDRCRRDRPPLDAIAPGHEVACWKAPIDGDRP